MAATRVAAVLAVTGAVVGARKPSDPTPISCSIDGIADYDRTLPFCDLMKQTRSFGSASSPYDGNCSVGPDGWPVQDEFGLIFITETGGPPPGGMQMNGTYLLSFYGNASLSFPVSTATLVSQVYDSTSGITEAAVYVPTTTNGQLWIGFRDAAMLGGAPGAKNISLLQPGCSADSGPNSFNPALLALVSRFDSLRFMDWVVTNGNLIESWAERRLPSAPSYAAAVNVTKGVAWETCIDLANAVGRDLWVNIPAHANDDYIAQLAALLYARADPTLTIYYEYSNEVWNWGFEQAGYNLQAANASVVSGDPFHLNYDGVNNPGYWAWRRVAYMAKHIADIFKTAFGADNVGFGKRVRPLLAGQIVQPIIVGEGLKYLENVWGAPNSILHGIAGAPYFNIAGGYNNWANLTIDEVFLGFNISIASMAPAVGVGEDNYLAGNVALAYHYGLQMRAYEGGPDTSGPNLGPQYLAVKGNATVDPRMQPYVATYLSNWYSYGRAVGPLNYFVAGASNLIDQYGVYGILYDMRFPVTYKTLAVDAVRAAPPPPTPASFARFPPFVANCSSDHVGHPVPLTAPNYCAYFGANATFDFFLQLAAPATLSVTVVVDTDPGVANATIGVQLGAGPEVVVACPAGSGVACAPALFPGASAGVDVVRLRSISGCPACRPYNIETVAFDAQ